MAEEALWTPGRTLHTLAQQAPDEIAVHLLRRDGGHEKLTRRQLDDWSSALAHVLAGRGVGPGDKVAIVLENSLEHVVATLASHKLGACPTPVNARMPATERDGLIALAQPAVLIADAPELEALRSKDIQALADAPAEPPPDCVPQPAKAIASGGSTGRPKLIVSPGAFAFPWQQHPLGAVLDFRPGELVYSPGPLFHNQAFFFSQIALFQGGSIALNERFDASLALDFIERERPAVLNLVPTMMQRMLRSDGFAQRDLSGIRRLWHLAAPCPEWAKLGWIEAIGAERVWELWAATEITGITTISGTDWLAHRGSVGRGHDTEILILDEQGQACSPGTVGEIYTRFADGSAQYAYLGAEPLPVVGDGYRSVGDMGSLDAEGYLYLADRRKDLIISGGANVYSAEVEAVLSAHPQVADVAVIGQPDEDLGRRVHAVVQPAGEAPDEDALRAHCAKHLSRYKIPRSFEFVIALPRNEAGKIRRSALLPD